MAELNPAQLTHVDDLSGVVPAVRAHLAGVRDVMTDTDVDVAAGRLHNVAGDTWAPHVVLISPDAAAGHDDELTGLLGELSRDRQTVAVVLTDSGDTAVPVDLTRWWLSVDSDGVLTVPALDLQLIAEQLPAVEAGPLTQLLVAAAEGRDQPTPAAQGSQPWDAFSDAAGNLRPEMTTTAAVPALKVAGTFPARTNSILPLSPAVYAETAATTEEDVLALSPGVGDEVRARLAASDPTLDEDLAAWWDTDSPRVKLRLLGPVDVWSSRLDPAPPGRPQKVEAIAYLATRPRGSSAARVREDLWPDDRNDKPTSKVRNLMLGARNWLGINPATGREHLPPNAGEDRGGLYVAEGILVDAELFRRLRLRAMTSGPAGISDLRAALDLVAGVPFEAHRPRGYGWNSDLVAHYTGMVADAAHIVATHHLAASEPEPAAAAAQVALLAGSTADNVLLDLVAACHARGDESAGNSYVQLIVDNHGEVEEDIPARTYEILLRHGWLPSAPHDLTRRPARRGAGRGPVAPRGQPRAGRLDGRSRRRPGLRHRPVVEVAAGDPHPAGHHRRRRRGPRGRGGRRAAVAGVVAVRRRRRRPRDRRRPGAPAAGPAGVPAGSGDRGLPGRDRRRDGGVGPAAPGGPGHRRGHRGVVGHRTRCAGRVRARRRQTVRAHRWAARLDQLDSGPLRRDGCVPPCRPHRRHRHNTITSPQPPRRTSPNGSGDHRRGVRRRVAHQLSLI